MFFDDPALAAEVGLAVHRWGGNSTSRYNYTNNFTNVGSDFFFENFENAIKDQSSDEFVLGNMVTESKTILTVGMLDKEPMLWSETHMDVHSDPASYDEVRDLGIAYHRRLKRPIQLPKYSGLLFGAGPRIFIPHSILSPAESGTSTRLIETRMAALHL